MNVGGGNNAVVMQFARAPIAGQVKTRLRAVLDATACLELHCAMVRHTFQQLLLIDDADLQLWVSAQHDFFLRLVSESAVSIHLQKGNSLGEKMTQAVRCGLRHYAEVVLVGSDCPAIDVKYVQSALKELRNGVPVVLGPASDGGYGLIAMRCFDQRIFDDICWGSDKVMQQTRERLDELGWVSQELTQIRDIDRPEDLSLLQSYSDLQKFCPDIS